jgi:hypothetical protein
MTPLILLNALYTAVLVRPLPIGLPLCQTALSGRLLRSVPGLGVQQKGALS